MKEAYSGCFAEALGLFALEDSHIGLRITIVGSYAEGNALPTLIPQCAGNFAVASHKRSDGECEKSN